MNRLADAVAWAMVTIVLCGTGLFLVHVVTGGMG